MYRNALTALALCAAATISVHAQGKSPALGRTPSPTEIRQRDITVLPNGEGLPDGKGTAVEGKAVYGEKCASCHGPNGEGNLPAGPRLVGGVGTLASDNPIKTVGSYWPYATTVWDYIHRAMPQNEPGSLSVDDTYAVTAFLLYRNNIIQRDDVMSKQTLSKVLMPNRAGFIPDGRPDIGRSSSRNQTSRKTLAK